MDEEVIDDPPLSTDQQDRVNQLNAKELQKIDETLIGNTGSSWRKVALVIGTTIIDLEATFRGIPDVFYAQRIKTLVERGTIQSQGNLDRMRYSEIRKIENHHTNACSRTRLRRAADAGVMR